MIVSVQTTFASRADALRIATEMIDAKLAACAQIEAVESLYIWDGALQHEPEVRVHFKTSKAGYRALEQALVAAHPYELPMIVASESVLALPEYERWVLANTQHQGED